MIRRALFELKYLLGNAPWDTGISPPELLTYLGSAPVGRSIDLGCGTGTNVITMAHHGWNVLGIDLSPFAINRARRKAAGLTLPVEFKRMDVALLPGVHGPFDLALDIGCYHSIPISGRASYRSRLESLLPAGADYLLYAWLPSPENGDNSPSPEVQIGEEFKACFSILSCVKGTDHGRASAWFQMRRKPT